MAAVLRRDDCDDVCIVGRSCFDADVTMSVIGGDHASMLIKGTQTDADRCRRWRLVDRGCDILLMHFADVSQ